MMHAFSLLLVVLALASCQPDKPTASKQTSPSGVSYELIQVPGKDTVAIDVAWGSDWAYRHGVNETVPGIGAELILAGGAKGYPAGKAGEIFADIKARAQLVAQADDVIGTLVVPRENLAKALAITNAHLLSPDLDATWFDRIRGQLQDRVREAESKDVVQASMTDGWAVLGDQPLRAFVSPSPAEIGQATRDAVISWHGEVFIHRPEALVVAGDLSPAAAGKAVDALLAGLPDVIRTLQREVQLNVTPRRILLHRADAKTSQLILEGPIPPLSKGGELENVLIVNALGGGPQSVLFKAVRLKLRASYAFGAGLGGATHAHPYLIMHGAVQQGMLAEVEKTVRATYAAFLQSGPTRKLSDLKLPLSAAFSRDHDNPANLGFGALMGLLNKEPGDTVLGLKKRLDAITRADVMAQLAHYPAPDKFVTVALSADPTALPGACVVEAPEAAKDCK
jgi:zinc protease